MTYRIRSANFADLILQSIEYQRFTKNALSNGVFDYFAFP